MSETQIKLDASSSSLKLLEETLPIIKLIDQQLIQSNSSEETDIWLKVRQQVIVQNELIKNYQQQRFIKTFQLIRQTCFWGIFISIAVALLISRMTTPAFIILGIVFYEISVDYRRYLIFNKTNYND